jgi:DNA-binding XRE family transcriptional regulator
MDAEMARELGRRGARALVAKYGREHFAAAGRAGAAALRARYRPLPGLQAARVNAGLTQEGLARSAGLGDGTHVGKIERGANAAPVTVAKLAAALGVDAAALRGS